MAHRGTNVRLTHEEVDGPGVRPVLDDQIEQGVERADAPEGGDLVDRLTLEMPQGVVEDARHQYPTAPAGLPVEVLGLAAGGQNVAPDAVAHRGIPKPRDHGGVPALVRPLRYARVQ